jgi:parallel beta-helix repeat protein
MLVLLITSMLAFASRIQLAKAEGTIYIRADGSIDPVTAPIRRDRDVYDLTGDIASDADGIMIERDNMILDGADHTVEGTYASNSKGASLVGRNNVTIKNTHIQAFEYGVLVDSCSNSSISGNSMQSNEFWGIDLSHSNNTKIGGNSITYNLHGINLHSSLGNSVIENKIANNHDGIGLDDSSNNSVIGNNIATNDDIGILLGFSSDNRISENIVANNGLGIYLYYSSNNTIYHNNFASNMQQVDGLSSTNVWDNGYPSGGNYWSDYEGNDRFSGPYQNETGNDGIYDVPYSIRSVEKDNYPLATEFSKVVGDLNGDSKVSLADLVLLAQAYGSKPRDSNWNANADIEGNNIVGLSDLVILAQHYGQHSP